MKRWTNILATARRPRILWVVMGALLLVTLAPVVLYHRQVLELSQEKLADTEKVQQTAVTRALSDELESLQINLAQQLVSQRQMLTLTGLTENLDDPKYSYQVTRLLGNFIESNSNYLYITAIGRSAKGPSSGDLHLDQDPFVRKELQRAYSSSLQGLKYRSGPLALAPDDRPAFVISVPLINGSEFAGMLAAVISLDRVVARLQEASVRGRVVYIVDRNGKLVAHADTKNFVPGTDVTNSLPLMTQIKDLPPELRTTSTRSFTIERNGRQVEMIGTFSTVPDMFWVVVAQRGLNEARTDAGVDELNAQALKFVAVLILVSLVLGYLFAVGITRPIRGLAASTRAISRGEFHERAPVAGAAEISELAETFNKMAGDIELFIEQLKKAAAENRELFLGSIQMLAAAIDEKDPYTRGHSGRVAKYSVIIGEYVGMSAADLDRLKISALLHDVGKIGVDDRVLKKPGALTAEEFEVMKQHPSKGANIMRPVAQLKEMLPGIELHHEHMDGRGYPYGLRAEQIPMMARIIAVADTLDAITTNRPYQSAMDLEFAMQRIRQFEGTKFDPRVVQALSSAIAAGKIRLAASVVEVDTAPVSVV